MRNGSKLKALLVDVERGETAREQIGNVICQFRADNDLAQKDLAELLEVTPQHMSDVEAGKRGLSDVVRHRLLSLLNGKAA